MSNLPPSISPLFELVQAEPLTLVALNAQGKPIGRFPTFDVAPDDWNCGHPGGALLVKDLDVDASLNERPVMIHGFRLIQRGGAAAGDVMPFTPIRIEPRVHMRLARCLVVPRLADPVPA